MIEHPLYDYESIVAIVATSEGFSRRELARHLWANLMPIWNMPKNGFQELYEKLPRPQARLRESMEPDRRQPEDALDPLREKNGTPKQQ
jgi:hypothetical protein